MGNYSTLGFNTNMQYELTSEDKGFIEYAANYIHDALKGNPDYVVSHFITGYENIGYLHVKSYFCLTEMKHSTPDFLASNSEWFIFCYGLKEKYEEEKSNERETGD